MDEVLRAIAEAAGELVGVPLASFWVANEAARTLEFRTSSDPMADDYPSRIVPYGEGGVGWVAVHRQTLEIEDIAQDPRFSFTGWAASHGLRSALVVPIVLQESLLGVLSLVGRQPIRLSPDDQQLLESFVAQAGVAIRNAGLYGETRGRLEESRALLEVAEILNSTLDSKRLLREVTMKIAQVCRVDRCSIQRWVDGRVVPLMSQFADGHQDPEVWERFRRMAATLPARPPLHSRTVDTRRPVIVPDASASDLIPPEWVEVFGVKSTMTVPLIRQDEVIGVMALDHTEQVTAFEPWQVDLAMAIAGQLALSLANTQLYTQVQERLRETTALLSVGRALSQPESTDHLMRSVAREVAHAFGADMVGVYSLDPKREALVPTAGYHVPKHLLEHFLSRPFDLAQFPDMAQVWREGRAAWSSDAQADPRFARGVLEGIGAHSVLFAPTTVRGEPVGALFLVWWQTGREFSDSEVRLLEGVAAQVGLGMENAELGRQTEVKLQETETLLSVSQTLASTLDVDTLTRQFLRHVARGLGADSAGLWLLADDGEWMAPLAGYHVPPERLEALRGPATVPPEPRVLPGSGRAAGLRHLHRRGERPAHPRGGPPGRAGADAPLRADLRPGADDRRLLRRLVGQGPGALGGRAPADGGGGEPGGRGPAERPALPGQPAGSGSCRCSTSCRARSPASSTRPGSWIRCTSRCRASWTSGTWRWCCWTTRALA